LEDVQGPSFAQLRGQDFPKRGGNISPWHLNHGFFGSMLTKK
jgi:hypothetical protein